MFLIKKRVYAATLGGLHFLRNGGQRIRGGGDIFSGILSGLENIFRFFSTIFFSFNFFSLGGHDFFRNYGGLRFSSGNF